VADRVPFRRDVGGLQVGVGHLPRGHPRQRRWRCVDRNVELVGPARVAGHPQRLAAVVAEAVERAGRGQLLRLPAGQITPGDHIGDGPERHQLAGGDDPFGRFLAETGHRGHAEPHRQPGVAAMHHRRIRTGRVEGRHPRLGPIQTTVQPGERRNAGLDALSAIVRRAPCASVVTVTSWPCALSCAAALAASSMNLASPQPRVAWPKPRSSSCVNRL
jgi:hypothetical protein